MSNHDGATQPILCHNGCGFFGSPDRRNLCSKCFTETTPTNDGPTTSIMAPPASVPDVMMTTPVKVMETPVIDSPSPAKVTTNRSRCGVCRKKLRLGQQFDCMCKDTFCGQHRYADAHDCQFDYIARNQEQLRKENPEVIASKINKI